MPVGGHTPKTYLLASSSSAVTITIDFAGVRLTGEPNYGTSHSRTYEEEAEEEEQRALKTRLRIGSTKVPFAEGRLPAAFVNYVADTEGDGTQAEPAVEDSAEQTDSYTSRRCHAQAATSTLLAALPTLPTLQRPARYNGPAQRPTHATPRIEAKQEMQQEDYDRLRPLSYTRPPASSSCASASTLPTPWSTIWSREAGATPTVPKRTRRSHREENDVWNAYTRTRPLPRREQQPMVPGELRAGWWTIIAKA
ncbi:hypothetical protein HPB50_015625 [Hyalomma asiaticum]|uniref:Uncharacterized protein n=1 Tax=Hyalomma asiaticum TaxID=266040 RepID=A0ACB7TL22_HYAAI|nr:hypothetical protein HPB50_015625 [Hyalomma asiaticum]